MGNNKAIQILRSSYNRTDDTIKNVELLDGQLFYSRKDKQLHIGDKDNYSSLKVGDTLPIGAANLVPGTGEGSIKQLSAKQSTHKNSIALGEGTQATAENQVVVGKYNEWSNDALFIVGNGAGDNDKQRKNAFCVYESGNGYFNGQVFIGKTWSEEDQQYQLSVGGDVKASGFTGNLTGNANTATKLQTPRTIGGVSFDGTENINLPGVNQQGSQNTTGNAGSATKLQTARTISITDGTNTGTATSFDGSANISIHLPTTIKATTFTATSDKRLKENLALYACEKSILNLPLYKYNFINDENKKEHIGCLAQDLQEICPEIVHEDNDGYLSINESKIVYLLLSEVKKLREEIDEMKSGGC